MITGNLLDEPLQLGVEYGSHRRCQYTCRRILHPWGTHRLVVHVLFDIPKASCNIVYFAPRMHEWNRQDRDCQLFLV